MLEDLLGLLVTLAAVLGVVALLLRTLRAALRLALATAEITRASGLAEVSARRGDLTALQERRDAEHRLRRRRRRDLALFALWVLWLALPPAAGWTPGAYAIAAPLWALRAR